MATAGLGSLSETSTNFVGDTMYTIALPPIVPVNVPRPFIGAEETEYVALTLLPEVAPLGAPMSSTPVIVPEGLMPFAENSPEKIDTPTVVGAVADAA